MPEELGSVMEERLESGLCSLLGSPHDSPAGYDVTPGSVPVTADAERNWEDHCPEAYHEFSCIPLTTR